MPARSLPVPRPTETTTTAGAAIKAALFALLALGTIASSGCHRGSGPEQRAQAFTWNGDLASPATVQIRNTMGSITVEPSADNQVHVVADAIWTRGDWKRDLHFSAVPAGSTVTVCALWGDGECTATNYSTKVKRNGMSFSFSSRSDAKVAFKVQIPPGVRIDAWTMDGSVTVRSAGPVKARTVNGSVKVGTSVGPVDAESMNGDVDIRMTTIGADTGAIRAVTKNGSVVAYVPAITDGRIEASTVNGRIGSDFGNALADNEGRSRTFNATLGAGTREYLVQTLNGSAWLRLINADGSVGVEGMAADAKGAVPAAQKAIRPPLSKRRNQ
jgi:hypothetical protein